MYVISSAGPNSADPAAIPQIMYFGDILINIYCVTVACKTSFLHQQSLLWP